MVRRGASVLDELYGGGAVASSCRSLSPVVRSGAKPCWTQFGQTMCGLSWQCRVSGCLCFLTELHTPNSAKTTPTIGLMSHTTVPTAMIVPSAPAIHNATGGTTTARGQQMRFLRSLIGRGIHGCLCLCASEVCKYWCGRCIDVIGTGGCCRNSLRCCLDVDVMRCSVWVSM